MDPTANLKEQLQLTREILDEDVQHIPECEPCGVCGCLGRGERLAELVQALNDWLTKGGFLPGPWAECGACSGHGGSCRVCNGSGRQAAPSEDDNA